MNPDVIVIGSGIAGLSTALSLGKNNIETLVIEKNRGVNKEKPIFTLTDHIRNSDMDRCISSEITRYRVTGPYNTELEYDVTDNIHSGCTINYPKALEILRKKILKTNHVEFMYKTPVIDVVENNDNVEVFTKNEKYEVPYVVDASGISQLTNKMRKNIIVARMNGYKLEGNFPENVIWLLITRKTGRWTWFVTKSNKKADLIVGDYFFEETHNKDKKLSEMLSNAKTIIEKKYKIKDTDKIHYRGETILTPISSNKKRIFQIGEAAGQGSPYSGDVFRLSMIYGKFLGNLIADHYGDEKIVEKYTYFWRHHGEIDYPKALALRNLRFDYEKIKKLVKLEKKLIEKYPIGELYELIQNHNIGIRHIAGSLKHTSIIFDFAKEYVNVLSHKKKYFLGA